MNEKVLHPRMQDFFLAACGVTVRQLASHM